MNSATYPVRPCPSPTSGGDSDEQKAVNELAEELCVGLPENIEDLNGDERGRWLLAQLLNWHRREAKSFWWRYFYLRDELTDEERREESDALGGLTFEDSWPDPRPKARSTIYRFRFPPQDHAIRVDDSPHDPETGKAAGKVVFIDEEEGLIERQAGQEPNRTKPYFVGSPRLRPPQAQAREPAASRLLDVLEHGIDGCRSVRTGRRATCSRVGHRGWVRATVIPFSSDGEDAQDAARRLVKARMDGSYLAVQGPPGSGKSTVGSGNGGRPCSRWATASALPPTATRSSVNCSRRWHGSQTSGTSTSP